MKIIVGDIDVGYSLLKWSSFASSIHDPDAMLKIGCRDKGQGFHGEARSEKQLIGSYTHPEEYQDLVTSTTSK